MVQTGISGPVVVKHRIAGGGSLPPTSKLRSKRLYCVVTGSTPSHAPHRWANNSSNALPPMAWSTSTRGDGIQVNELGCGYCLISAHSSSILFV